MNPTVMHATRHGIGLLGLLVLLGAHAPGQGTATREPHIGYVFPAGAQRGTTVELLVGGQMLRGSQSAVVSGGGVSVKVTKVYRPLRNLDKEQRAEVQRRIAARRAVLDGQPVPPPPSRPADAPAFVMPEHPLLDRLEHADAAEIEHLVQVYLRANRTQVNTQLGELVTLAVDVDPAAAPGARELRLLTASGLTNPVRFEVGATPEAEEREPNDPRPFASVAPPVVALPVTLNGQVLPGDVDRWRIHARRGQNLVIEVQARSLIPYLADAVPGWFQPVLALLDPAGKEVAYADDYRFRPDPVLFFKIPDDGDYSLEIRDSIFRGREDFVYRVVIAERPFVTSCFPLGASVGTKAEAALTGWNLPRNRVVLDTRPEGKALRELVLPGKGLPSNPVAYVVDELPDVPEGSDNDTAGTATKVPFPGVVNGRIERPGDVDMFRVEARAGDELVVEVLARQLGSPLDSVVRVVDAAGNVAAWNDDHMAKEGHLHLGPGLLTHHADSRLQTRLPADGPWFVRIEDAQRQGGEACGYRLRVSAARPDFALRIVPSALNVMAGQVVPVTAFVERRDGFQGPVTLGVEGDATGEVQLAGAVVPAGRDRVRFTLEVPGGTKRGVRRLQWIGRADTGGGEIERMAEPADDMMQAFLWRHLVAAREWMLWVAPAKGRVPPVRPAEKGPLQIPEGGSGIVSFQVPPWILQRGMDVSLVDAPAGLTISNISSTGGRMQVTLRAEAEQLPAGFADNVILGAAVKVQEPATADPKKGQRRGPAQVVVLPALPMLITAKSH